LPELRTRCHRGSKEWYRAALEEVGVKADKAEKIMKLLESKRGAVLNL
jgi:hypothetical protein